MKRKSVLRCAAALAVASVVLAFAPAPSATARVDIGFPTGFYDQVYKPGPFSYMTSKGMNATLPYGTGSGIGTYLAAAASSGLGVYVQLDPTLVRANDIAGVTAIVGRYKDSPALRAWYLADEPTIGSSPISPEILKGMYDAIKVADPVHPVAIAFNSNENASLYHDAMDVMLWDSYPARTGSPEFSNLGTWRSSLKSAATTWERDKAFVPIIQAFGANGAKYAQFRLPTPAEERYMIYSALQTGVDGMFFWSYYAMDPTWRTNVFDPLMSEVQGMLPTMRTAPLAGAKSSYPNVTVSMYRDPSTKRYVLVAVNNLPTTVRPIVTIASTIPVSLHKFRPTFKPYEVRTLRF